MNPATDKTIIKVLQPLIRFLLRHGVLFHHFMELVRWVYVDVALASSIDGKKATKSRASVLTGLSRVEVGRQAARERPETSGGQKWHRTGRVLSAWANEPAYTDVSGAPKKIPVSADGACFESLVSRHSGGATTRSVLDELLRVEAVNQDDEGMLTLLRPYYLVDDARDSQQQVDILGWSAGSLLETLEHNTRADQPQLRFQRLVFEEDIPLSILPQVRAQLRLRGQDWANQTDGFLTDVKESATTDDADDAGGTAYAGMGIYYFEQPTKPSIRSHNDEEK